MCACRIQKLKQVLALPVPSCGKDSQEANVGETKVHETQRGKKPQGATSLPCSLRYTGRVAQCHVVGQELHQDGHLEPWLLSEAFLTQLPGPPDSKVPQIQ